MRVPEAGWFTRVLLYWDAVGIIWPHSLRDPAKVSGGYTHDLIAAGLVDPISPSEAFHPSGTKHFGYRFFAIVDAEGEEVVRRRSAGRKRVQVHGAKFGDLILGELQARGLASPSPSGSSDYPGMSWDVEPYIAGIYMAYLAASLGSVKQMDPISDTIDLFVPATRSPVARAEALRLSVLEEILPAPEGPMAIRELADFKERQSESLRSFRNMIESELLRIALIDDDEARAREKQLTEDRLRREVGQLASAMRQRRWPRIVFGTIAGIASVAATAAAAVEVGGAAIAFAAPGVISGAYAAVERLPRRTTPGSPTSESPLAFAASAKKSFGQ